MLRKLLLILVVLGVGFMSSGKRMSDFDETNPILKGWAGSYGGVPPFDKVKVEHFKPAIEKAMAEALQKIEEIANSKELPTFENTIAELERNDRKLNSVLAIYFVWSSTMSSPEFQAVENEIEPKLAEFSDKIYQNESLFKRIESIYNSPEKSRLTAEQQRLVWLYYTNFVRAGAKLSSERKKRLSEINQQLAKLYTKFSQNLLADETEKFLVLKDESELAGLPQWFRDAASQAAISKGLKGSWVVLNTRSSIEPFLTYSERRDLREKAWRMFVNRGDNGDKNDNNAVISEILRLRAERAKLLGYKSHAHWRLEDSMARTPERAMELMQAVWKLAVARVRQEVADMQAIADKEGAGIKIEPWDYRYYAEKVRKAKYDLDENEIKPYLQLEKLREGMFWVAEQLFGLKFKPVNDVPVYHPDVKVWEVVDAKTGKHVGLWYFDPYAREGKRSGAWMSAYRNQEKMDGNVTAIVSNNSNFIKGNPNEPILISWDDTKTLFHEFGHALHGLCSNVTYPSLSGTNVPRDYVEFPSQLLEHWLLTPEVLQKFAVHYKTGDPIPKELIEKIKRASTFNQGFATVEYLAGALVDMKIHLAASESERIDPDKFEREALEELGMPKEIVMRHRLPQFAHIFSSDSYSAGYYSYLWADVITADAYEAFIEAGGPYDKKVAEKLVRHVFSVGNMIDPAEAYKLFRGRDPRIEALMRKKGFLN